jgi:hypothetical protein
LPIGASSNVPNFTTALAIGATAGGAALTGAPTRGGGSLVGGGGQGSVALSMFLSSSLIFSSFVKTNLGLAKRLADAQLLKTFIRHTGNMHTQKFQDFFPQQLFHAVAITFIEDDSGFQPLFASLAYDSNLKHFVPLFSFLTV